MRKALIGLVIGLLPAICLGNMAVSSGGLVTVTGTDYKATINETTGVPIFYGADDVLLFTGDYSIKDNDATTYLQSGAASAIVTITVNTASTATVTVAQTYVAPALTYLTTYNFTLAGNVICTQAVTYTNETRILDEKFLLAPLTPTNYPTLVDDSTSDYDFAYIGATTQRQKKIFTLATVPYEAHIYAYMARRRDTAPTTGWTSTCQMSVNGNLHDISSVWGALANTVGGIPKTWTTIPVDVSELVEGTNEIVFYMSARPDTEYTYFGFDQSVAEGRGYSAWSTDSGANYISTDLCPGGGDQTGEYMIRLYTNYVYDTTTNTTWNGATNAFASSATLSRYSPRILRVPFTNSSTTKATIFGSDYGASNIEDISWSASAVSIWVSESARGGADFNIDPRTGDYLNPADHSQSSLLDITRYAAETVTASYAIQFSTAFPTTRVFKTRWPRVYTAAWTMDDDADSRTLDILNATYYGTSDTESGDYGTKGFASHNLKTDITVFWSGATGQISNNTAYRDAVNALGAAGFGTSLHTASNDFDRRATTTTALNNYAHYIWTEHAPYTCYPTDESDPLTNLEDLQCLGGKSDSLYYILDLLEASTIKYIAPASTLYLSDGVTDALTFTHPRYLPRYTTYVNDQNNIKQMLIFGRYGRVGSAKTFAAATTAITNIINSRDYTIGYTHTAADNWYETSGSDKIITANAENYLVAVAAQMDAGVLWVEPVDRIIDWMVDWEKVQITSQEAITGGVRLVITNTSTNDVTGLTLTAPTGTNITSATIGTSYQIYVSGTLLVLPKIAAGASVTVDIITGAYGSRPRVLSVATDVNILNAEYSASKVLCRAQGTGYGLNTDREIVIDCTDLGDVEWLDNGHIFATVESNVLTSSDAAYSVVWDDATPKITFELPSTATTRVVQTGWIANVFHVGTGASGVNGKFGPRSF